MSTPGLVALAPAALDDVDPTSPSTALPLVRTDAEHLTEAIDEAMAAAILEEGATIGAAGSLAGLSENTVGPAWPAPATSAPARSLRRAS